MEDGFVKVVSPIDDTPASRAGVKSGDLIVKLDETSVKGMTLNDAVKRMRGKPNTQITLTIVRKGEEKPIVAVEDTVMVWGAPPAGAASCPEAAVTRTAARVAATTVTTTPPLAQARLLIASSLLIALLRKGS